MKHLFILSGQSNMEGMNPETSFIPLVEAEYGKENVTIVKDAHNGQPIRRWYKKWKSQKDDESKVTGDLYDRLMTKVHAEIIGIEIDTVTFVWMQGERDAKERYGEVYGDSLKGLLSQLSEDLERSDIHFVIGRLSAFDMENVRYRHWTLVRNAQIETANVLPRAAWIDTDDLIGEDAGLHYTKDGYTILGERFALKSIELIKNNTQLSAHPAT